jgi:hypothetical protein
MARQSSDQPITPSRVKKDIFSEIVSRLPAKPTGNKYGLDDQLGVTFNELMAAPQVSMESLKLKQTTEDDECEF